MEVYAGLDWGAYAHALCVIDAAGKVVQRADLDHDADGLDKLVRLVGKWPGLKVAIERPSGLVVDVLLEAGAKVVPIHPNVVKASRPRYRVSGAKSDPGDAYLLADLLRTDGHRFEALEPDSDEVRALRAMVRTRDDLVATRVQLANQLRALLDAFWPGGAAIFADVDSPIALAFLRRYPSPGSAAKLDGKRLAAFLARHRYSGRRTPEQLLERLRAAPAGRVGEVEEEARAQAVLALVGVLAPLVDRIAELTGAVEHAVGEIAVGRIVMSLPRTGRVNAAQIVAELGEDPAKYGSFEHLAAEAGIVPVTRESGKHRAVVARFACNKRLRQALTCWADNSRHGDAWAADVYRRARARGCNHPHAVRILARAWLRVLWRCWHDGVPYDAQRHDGAVRARAA